MLTAMPVNAGTVDKLLETGGVAVAVILAIGVVLFVVGKTVVVPSARLIAGAMADHRESSSKMHESAVAAKDAAVASKESAFVAHRSLESCERIADRLLSKQHP